MKLFAVLFTTCTCLLLSPLAMFAINGSNGTSATTGLQYKHYALGNQPVLTSSPPELPYLPEPRVAKPTVTTVAQAFPSDLRLPYLPEPRVIAIS